jgi:dTDP-4-dehydrorhamnose reductase
MVDDQTSVPTPSAFIAEYTKALLERNASGLLHLVPSGQATRYEFARAVVQATGSRSRVEAARTSDFPGAAQRPAYSVLDNRRAGAVLGLQLPTWKDFLP